MGSFFGCSSGNGSFWGFGSWAGNPASVLARRSAAARALFAVRLAFFRADCGRQSSAARAMVNSDRRLISASGMSGLPRAQATAARYWRTNLSRRDASMFLGFLPSSSSGANVRAASRHSWKRSMRSLSSSDSDAGAGAIDGARFTIGVDIAVRISWTQPMMVLRVAAVEGCPASSRRRRSSTSSQSAGVEPMGDPAFDSRSDVSAYNKSNRSAGEFPTSNMPPHDRVLHRDPSAGLRRFGPVPDPHAASDLLAPNVVRKVQDSYSKLGCPHHRRLTLVSSEQAMNPETIPVGND